ncbi:MAG: DUF805 domain-containing protein [Pseudomonadota bacterium]
MMTFQESIRTCLNKCTDFNGRASRPEFWWFVLFVGLVEAALSFVSEILGNVFLVLMALPLLAAGARRFHDIGRTAWWWMFAVVPFAGIFLLAFLWAFPTRLAPVDDTSVE